jgi:C1A family cysteine protease
MIPRKIAGYGWTRDSLDPRDHKYAAPRDVLLALPDAVDLRPECPAVYDQSSLGSCTANAIGGDVEFLQLKEKLPHVWVPSRLFIYYNERVIEGTVSSDAGAQIRDGIKSVNSTGVCSEDLWKYDVTKFADQPPTWCYTNAHKHLVTSYASVPQTFAQMQGCLASGYPFVFGFTVYESFESVQVAQTGVVPMPQPGEQILGGHAVMAVGYDAVAQTLIVRNSWGPSWGQAGYFVMPAAYMTDPNLASDFWTLRLVQGTPTS